MRSSIMIASHQSKLPIRKKVTADCENRISECRATQTSRLESKQASKPLEKSMKTPFVLGRLLFGGFFLYNGINHILNRKTLSQYAGSKKVPVPDVAVAGSGVALILGGASILLGIKPKLGAAVIIGFLAGVSPIMHDFWQAEDPNQRTNDMVNFAKNMALLGGAAALAAVEEPWPASVPFAQPRKMQRLRRALRRSIAA
jgi:putative oxidoreductase